MSVCDKAADASCKGQCLRQGALAFGVGGAVQERRTVLVTGGARRIGRAIRAFFGRLAFWKRRKASVPAHEPAPARDASKPAPRDAEPDSAEDSLGV